MSVTDLIADQLAVIKNALVSGKTSAVIKRSVMMEGIVAIMKREGFINNFKVIDDKKQGKIKVYLKDEDAKGTPVLEGVKKISTPGRREYQRKTMIKSIRGGVGVVILSTNKGLLTDKEAHEQGVGGEVICHIW
ncbi:MAG TPA: 30S ribosomal protein S8 [Candidatus Omnitrophota bacterium]|nr:30S ribosomal protein S8 [Candidatus Omnitrophota bacterium]